LVLLPAGGTGKKKEGTKYTGESHNAGFMYYNSEQAKKLVIYYGLSFGGIVNYIV
jgi:hypothetical protein